MFANLLKATQEVWKASEAAEYAAREAAAPWLGQFSGGATIVVSGLLVVVLVVVLIFWLL